MGIKHVDSDNQNGHTVVAMVLNDYLTSKNIDAETFGKLIGVKYPSVCRYLRGKRTPKYSIMQKIIAVTDGAVTADDFYHKKPDAPLVSERQASLDDCLQSFPSTCNSVPENRTPECSHKDTVSGSTKISPTLQEGV
jgi:hypothetical protein